MGKTLRNPILDIHYNARQERHDSEPEKDLPCTLIISVHAKHLGSLYDQVVRKYARQFEVLRPVIDIPITT